MTARLAHATPLLTSAEPALRRPVNDVQLDRICALLGVNGALLVGQGGISQAFGGMLPTPPDLATMTAGDTLGTTARVIADTATDPHLPLLQAHFLAIVPIPTAMDQPGMTLVLWDGRPRSLAMAYRLLALATEVTGQATLARWASFHEHNRMMFERASATARIGVWVCDLPSLKLSWTNGVYDLFELPRGSVIDRAQTAALYTDASREQMERLRSQAIAECGEFHMDAEIVTAKGNQRWMRLTGAVESENGVATRIFGMKQDITEEKLLADRTRYLAEFDVMTGLANRSQFQNRLADLDGLRGGKPIGGLLVIDLDGFKQINDTHGHAMGDDLLKEAARRLVACCGKAELVARIGGDEFAVLLASDTPAIEVELLAHAAVGVMGRPAQINGQSLSMGASIGVAHRGPGTGEDLFRQADTALYAAKAAGRGTSCVFG